MSAPGPGQRAAGAEPGPGPGGSGALGELVGSGAAPLGERPALTTPPQLQSPELRAREAERLRRQPGAGLAGLVLAAPIALLLAFGAGGAEASVVVLGPITTFALAAVAMVAFWWEDWPGSSLRPGWAALADTVLIVVLAVVLTVAGQAVVAHADLAGVFDPTPGAGHPATFPVTLPLASTAFVAMLQLTLVCERWPLVALGRFSAGLAALVLVWVVAVAVHLLLVDLSALPVAERAASGIRDPGGPVAAADLGAWLVCVGVWQTLIFIAWRGSPLAGLRRWQRLLAGNVVVLAGGWATYLALDRLAGWEPGQIAAAGGSTIAAALLLSMLFDGWPAIRASRRPGRILTLALIGLIALGIDRGLAAYGDGVDWSRVATDDWVTVAALNFVGVAVILHVAVWRRWPLPRGYRRSEPGR